MNKKKNGQKRGWTLLMVLIFIALAQAQEKSDHDIYTKVDSALARYNYVLALDYLEQLKEKDLFYYQQSGRIKTILGQWRSAVEDYNQALARDSLNVSLLNALAELQIKRKQYPEAVGLYGKLVQLDSTNPYYYKKLGLILTKRGMNLPASDFFRRSLMYNPKDIEVLSLLAKFHLDQKAFAVADSLLAEARSFDSTNVGVIMLQVQSAYRQEEYRACLDYCQSLLSAEGDTSSFFLRYRGYASYKNREYPQAIKALKTLLEGDGEPEIPLFYLGMAYAESGEYDSSQTYLTKAIEAATSEFIGNYYLNLAFVEEQRKETEAAISAFKKAYNYTARADMLFYLAYNYEQLYRDKSTAIQFYERYLEEAGDGELVLKQQAQERLSQLKRVMHFKAD